MNGADDVLKFENLGSHLHVNETLSKRLSKSCTWIFMDFLLQAFEQTEIRGR